MYGIPNGKALRLGRHSLPEQVYLVTATTYRRRPIFSNLYTARLLVNSLIQAEDDGHLTMAYVVMPDHFHWLLKLGVDRSLSASVQKIKSITTKAVRALRQDVSCEVWQKGFHDHAIRDDENLKHAARYIVMNPVRAGLCSTPKDYSHWDCIWLSMQKMPA